MTDDSMAHDLTQALGPFWPGARKTRKAVEYARWSHLFRKSRFSPLEYYAAVEEVMARKRIPELRMGRVTWKERGLFSARREYLRIERGRYVYDICAAPFGVDFFFSSWLVILPPALTKFHYLGMGATALSIVIIERLGGFWWLLVRGYLAYGIFWVLALAFVPLLIILTIWLVRSDPMESTVENRIALEEFFSGMTFFLAIHDRFFRPLTYFEQDTAAMFQKSVHSAMMEVIDGLSGAQGLRPMNEDERKPEFVLKPLFSGLFGR